MDRLLELHNFHYYYGNIHAIKGIDLYVKEGEIVTIIGANGAGKSTTLRTISGLTESRGIRGEILLEGENIAGIGGHRIASKGIMQVLEGRHVFSQLTVYENMMMGAYLRKDNKVKEDVEHLYKRFPRLKERKDQLGGTLSGGEQQMLAISRALMARPSLLLLDEPSLGLAPIIIQQIFAIIHKVNANGTTVFLVEQNANQALRIAHRGYVMENGRISMEGLAEDLLQSPEVRSAYLGM